MGDGPGFEIGMGATCGVGANFVGVVEAAGTVAGEGVDGVVGGLLGICGCNYERDFFLSLAINIAAMGNSPDGY
jgi:hypothetical protein